MPRNMITVIESRISHISHEHMHKVDFNFQPRWIWDHKLISGLYLPVLLLSHLGTRLNFQYNRSYTCTYSHAQMWALPDKLITQWQAAAYYLLYVDADAHKNIVSQTIANHFEWRVYFVRAGIDCMWCLARLVFWGVMVFLACLRSCVENRARHIVSRKGSDKAALSSGMVADLEVELPFQHCMTWLC